MNMLKKYLTMMLLLGLACPATACNSSSSSEDEVPPHLKPETPEEPGRDYYPKADGATRLVTYNVGVFTKYVSDGSYQMIADMMTEGKADLVGISELDSCTRVDDCVTPYCRIASARKSTTMNTTAYSQPGQARCLGFGAFAGSTAVVRSSSTSVVAAAAGMDGLDAGVVSCDGSFNAWGSLCTMWVAPNP